MRVHALLKAAAVCWVMFCRFGLQALSSRVLVSPGFRVFFAQVRWTGSCHLRPQRSSAKQDLQEAESLARLKAQAPSLPPPWKLESFESCYGLLRPSIVRLSCVSLKAATSHDGADRQFLSAPTPKL